MTERCEDCRFWNNSSMLDGHENTGRCRRRAPVADDRTGQARWAYTEDVDWCGEFEPDPERVSAAAEPDPERVSAAAEPNPSSPPWLTRPADFDTAW